MEKPISDKQALEALEKGYGKAEKLLKNQGEFDRFLARLENKLRTFPIAGDKLAYIPIFVAMIKSYVKKEYTNIPTGAVIAIISALLYFLSPVDIIPDFIPGFGHLDDIAVVGICVNLVLSDINDYIAWRDSQ